MVIHFIGSKGNILDEIAYYRAIITEVKTQGHSLANEWVEGVYTLARNGRLKKEGESWTEIDRERASAISKADVVIVEATAKSFFSGYQVAQAVAQKKPILILTRENSPMGIEGLETPTGFIKSVMYNGGNLHEIIKSFLIDNTVETKDLRFNFFLDRQSYNYLRWMSLKTGKTKAQILRSLLQKEMRSRDD